MNGLGIDIGGTKIAYALINNQGEIISEVKKTATPKTLDEIYNTLKIKKIKKKI